MEFITYLSKELKLAFTLMYPLFYFIFSGYYFILQAHFNDTSIGGDHVFLSSVLTVFISLTHFIFKEISQHIKAMEQSR